MMPARRHLCVVTETYPPEVNGVALTLARLVHGLRARGHAVSIVRPRQRGEGGSDDDPEVTLVSGVALPGYQDVRIGLSAGRLLRARWTARRPHAVYVATEGPLGWSALRAAEGLGIPVLSGFHTNFHGYARHYGARWSETFVFRYLRRFHNRTDGTLVAGVDLRDQLQAAGFRNLHVLGRGVDRRLFTPERRSRTLRRTWGASDDDLVVLHVGRLAPEKNVSLAIAAYRAMQRESDTLRLVVVGDGPLRATLEGTHPDVRFCGVRTGEDLAEHYASADVFLFPSETETFGNVTLEALASGVAVVAYDYAAAHEYIVSGETGVLVPRGQPGAFVERCATLARSPRAVQAIRRRAPESVRDLDWPDVVARFDAIVAGALAARALPRRATTALAVGRV